MEDWVLYWFCYLLERGMFVSDINTDESDLALAALLALSED